MNIVDFPNIGFLLDDVPKPILNKLKKFIEKKDLKKSNKDLAGNIEKEFRLNEKFINYIEPYIFELIDNFENKFNYLKDDITYLNKNIPLVLSDLWVNFQNKYEFNPLHNHKGVFSFVIWYKIPYLIEEERQSSPGKESNHNMAGHFQFTYTNSLGKIKVYSLPVDKTWEGKISLFPAKLYHSVFPFFTSNQERITIAGNVLLNAK